MTARRAHASVALLSAPFPLLAFSFVLAALAAACGSETTGGAPGGGGTGTGGTSTGGTSTGGTDTGGTAAGGTGAASDSGADVAADSTPADDATPAGSFDDPRDGHRYDEVAIAGSVWMGQNLAWAAPSGSYCYGDDPANCVAGGRLYTFDAATTACPAGWHLSTDDEWKALESFLGMPATDLDADGYSTVRGSDEGTKLKLGGPSGLDFPMTGYASIAGGQVTGWDGLTSGAVRSYIWTSTPGGVGVLRRRLDEPDPHVFRFSNSADGFAIVVRCVRD